jgi:hypothetical protein
MVKQPEIHSPSCPGLVGFNQKFEYFMDRTEKDMDDIKEKIEELITFKIMIIGASTAMSALVTLVLNVWLKTH